MYLGVPLIALYREALSQNELSPISEGEVGNVQYEPEEDLDEQLARGDLKFTLAGHSLRGSFVLVKTKRRTKPGVEEWLLIKHRDDHADPDWDIDAHSESLASGRTLSAVRQGYLVA